MPDDLVAVLPVTSKSLSAGIKAPAPLPPTMVSATVSITYNGETLETTPFPLPIAAFGFLLRTKEHAESIWQWAEAATHALLQRQAIQGLPVYGITDHGACFLRSVFSGVATGAQPLASTSPKTDDVSNDPMLASKIDTPEEGAKRSSEEVAAERVKEAAGKVNATIKPVLIDQTPL